LHSGKKSILVVDDDETVLLVLKEILLSKGYRVDTAETGTEAIEKSNTRYYNLALLDIRLPDMSGTRLLAKMHRANPRMVKIMVTGYSSLDYAIEAVNKGADAYLTKPVKPDSLLKVVEQKLKEQEEAEIMTKEKAAKYVGTRVRRIESS